MECGLCLKTGFRFNLAIGFVNRINYLHRQMTERIKINGPPVCH